MNIAFFTLGCKVNQFETQALELLLSQRGHRVTDSFTDADVIVVNTCTVTAVSDQKSRQAIRRLRRTYPNARIAVCGCLSQMNPESVRKIDGVDIIAGSAGRREFVERIEEKASDKLFRFTPDNALLRREFEDLPSGGLSGHTRAMLKIEDGCNNFCSYCIIPHARGPVRSMLPERAVEQAKSLSARGYREIVLTGIEISSYGIDFKPAYSLESLVADICSAASTVRIRLGSIEPRTITEHFCEALKSFDNLCPHFHLSLQSGCDSTLARMRRKYDTARFFESVRLLRRAFPDCAVTTDLIVGFPGETDFEFSQTLAFIEKCEFAAMHIFPYSKRNGTPAAEMPEQLSRGEKAERAHTAAVLAETLKSNYLQGYVGRTLSVLFEEEKDGIWSGLSKNYIRVYVSSDERLHNIVCDVKITELFRDGVIGKKI